MPIKTIKAWQVGPGRPESAAISRVSTSDSMEVDAGGAKETPVSTKTTLLSDIIVEK